MKHRALAESLPLIFALAVLVPAAVLAQEEKAEPPPTAETRAAEPSLTPTGGPTPQPLREFVDELRDRLSGQPPQPRPAAAGTAKAAEKGGAVSLQRELLWEEDVEEFERQRTLQPKKRLLQGGVADVHVVQPGDTLWDLSSRYLNNAWLWPRVWSYNPHITNPHWIYPGQVIRFGPRGAPTDETKVAAVTSRPQPKIIPGTSGLTVFLSTAFVTKEELKYAGTIDSSREEMQLLSQFDEAYVKFRQPKDAKTGDVFLAARVGPEIEHPATGESMGHLVQITGELKVVAPGSDRLMHTARIGKSWRTVERGNRALPAYPLTVKVERTPNKKNLRGYVFGAVEETVLGQHQLVFIDLGAKQGVEVGNRFAVVRRGDAFEGRSNDQMPLEEIAEAIVLATQPNTCVALLRNSRIEVAVGDKVEMRSGE